jgi:rRNA maturation protein Nop10
MQEYNEADVLALEDLFYRLRPYIRNVQISNYSDEGGQMCPVCGSDDIAEEGNYYTPAGRWTAYRCKACKCLSRGKENLLPKSKRKSLLINS